MSADKTPAKPFDYQSFLATLTPLPGVYQMIDETGKVIYVGKARNLKKRVTSYFKSALTTKTQAMIAKVTAIEITVTQNETEALLLEANLIKEIRPRYNVLLKDDKSYPYIYLNTDHKYPRLEIHRGAKRKRGRYFGPYPSAGAARECLNILQKCFLIRQCSDSFFLHRQRPCLQYQIKRCSAPCVELIDENEYKVDLQRAIMFLEGKSHTLIEDLSQKMQAASDHKAYEKAAAFRDQIQLLRKVHTEQSVDTDRKNTDVIALVTESNVVCICVLFIRDGLMLGSRSFFPRVTLENTTEEIMSQFLSQYYANPIHQVDIPGILITNTDVHENTWLQAALTSLSDKKVVLKAKPRGIQAKWLRLAEKNALTALQSRLNSQQQFLEKVDAFKQCFDVNAEQLRIECFDISHHMGEKTVASCVVFDDAGPRKSDYRRYNITDITPGDDYAAMYQVLSKRYTKIKSTEGLWPDVILIDGGKGQTKQAEKVLEELQAPPILVVGVAKGPKRKSGLETLLVDFAKTELKLESDSKALQLICQVRDEAHNFAITGHRGQIRKQKKTSTLESIAGIGAKRRKALLSYFGGLQAIKQASVNELMQVQGINNSLAQLIYDTFHETD